MEWLLAYLRGACILHDTEHAPTHFRRHLSNLLGSRPLRIIGCNETEIHYDCWWPELQCWSFSGSRKSRVSFYRTSVQAFLNGASLLEIRTLDAREWKQFRPDLPLHLFRSHRMQWSDLLAAPEESLDAWCHRHRHLLQVIGLGNVSEWVLAPLKKHGSPAKGIRIQIDASHAQAGLHLLWHAAQIQAQMGTPTLLGMGMYRMGYDGGCASYYLGGAHDLAGLYPTES